MLAILISWITILFVLFSLGDMFIHLYNKLCNNKEQYGFLDTFFLGMCFILIPLQFTSLWLPSNHYMLLAYIIICIAYWACNKERTKVQIRKITDLLNSLTLFQKILICIALLAVIFHSLFLSYSFDSEYYHYQQIRWNEEFSVVPGLGNLEDRFGFNSNYLLLSALFSFRFLFPDSIYTLQDFVFALLLCWALVKFFREKHNVNYLILLFLLFFVFLISDTILSNTSTDVIPFMCIFYYVVNAILKPSFFSKQPLIAYFLPVVLITFKVSTAIFCLTSLVVLFLLLRNKQSKFIAFFLSFSFLIVALWCVRNVIITGYLVYPVSGIDLFSFDWEMPKGVLILQKEHIYKWADFIGKDEFFNRILTLDTGGYKFMLLGRVAKWIIGILFVVSPVLMIISYFKKRVHKSVYALYLLCAVCIVFVFFSAPDFRFALGYIFGIVFMTVFFLLNLLNKEQFHFRKNRNFIVAVFALIFIIIAYKKKQPQLDFIHDRDKTIVKTILHCPVFHPWSSKPYLQFSEYKLGNLAIHLKVIDDVKTFDVLPATNNGGLPYSPFNGDKIQSIRTIENRGNSLQDGFRTKKEYFGVFDKNIERYTKEYQKLFITRHIEKQTSGF